MSVMPISICFQSIMVSLRGHDLNLHKPHKSRGYAAIVGVSRTSDLEHARCKKIDQDWADGLEEGDLEFNGRDRRR